MDNTLNASPAQLPPPPIGLDAALRLASEGWAVHPAGASEVTASDDPKAISAAWANDPNAAVIPVRLSLSALLRHARAGHGADISIPEICRMAAKLGRLEREEVFKMLKLATGIPLATLRAEGAGGAGKEGDQLELARAALATIGAENIIYTRGSFWRWYASGVWREVEDTAIRQEVQRSIAGSGRYAVTAGRVGSVTDVLRNDIYRPDHEFNIGTPETVNCLNGELELIDGRWHLMPHRREHFRTTQIPVRYDPNAQCRWFWWFLNDVFRDDADREDKINCVLEYIGYTLMSHARQHKFLMLIGGGRNGKSVLLDVVRALCGASNVSGVKPSQFGNNFQRAHLYQKLANIVADMREGEVVADGDLKEIVAGESTTVERKNRDPFDMRPFCTCWFGTNHMPHTRDFSDALFARAVILTFNRTYVEAEQDKYLIDKLTGELPGILNLVLAWYAHAVASGFHAPASSEAAKARWRREADQVAQFVDERCETDPGVKIAVEELYRLFELWAAQSGVRKTVTKRTMGDRLERLGFKRHRSDGTWILGLKLRP